MELNEGAHEMQGFGVNSVNCNTTECGAVDALPNGFVKWADIKEEEQLKGGRVRWANVKSVERSIEKSTRSYGKVAASPIIILHIVVKLVCSWWC